ncbi:hypothetical protein FRC07_009896 [Ceratobasidium sp. 392]|nr:hypothetical protein FRC07_009896 [Ceratobasidium sp. 392]
MTYQPKPTANGPYRIKVLTQNLYIEDDTASRRPGLKLAPPSSSNKQVWNLAQVTGQTDVWTITSAYDKDGLTYAKTEDTFWGYGYPYPQSGPSKNWSITEKSSENQTYSKITLSGNSDCFDSCDPENPHVVHFYYDHKLASGGPNQCYVFEPVSPGPTPGPTTLDIVFMQDLTGSQQPYFDAILKEIDQIWKNLQDKGGFAPGQLRASAIGFRDHPPQDDSFASKLLIDFTPNIDNVATALASYQITGGGDSCESQTDALAASLSEPTWNTQATKVAVLITDSPPHGIKEPGDAWPNKCPCQKDPLGLAKRMFRMGITLYVIACEPTLSQYFQGGRSFYEGLVQKTHGKVYNLGDDPNLLSQVIVGSALQAVDSNKLVAQHRAAIRTQAQASNFNAAAFAQKLHGELLATNVQHHTLTVDSMVEPNPAADKIAQIWAESDTLEEAHAKIQQAAPNRVKEEYLDGALPTANLAKKPITLDQVQAVVQKCLQCEA